MSGFSDAPTNAIDPSGLTEPPRFPPKQNIEIFPPLRDEIEPVWDPRHAGPAPVRPSQFSPPPDKTLGPPLRNPGLDPHTEWRIERERVGIDSLAPSTCGRDPFLDFRYASNATRRAAEDKVLPGGAITPLFDPAPPSIAVEILGPNGSLWEALNSVGSIYVAVKGARAATCQGGGIPGISGPRLGPSLGPPLHRPYLRRSTIEAIEARYRRAPDGRFIDPVTNRPIDPPYDLGHVPFRENWRLTTEAMERGMNQEQFNDWVNSHPEWFRIENRSRNQSHQDEARP